MSKKKVKEIEKVALSLRLPEPLHKKLEALAVSENRSLNQQAQRIFEQALN